MAARLGERLLTSPWRWLLLPAWLLFRPLVWLRNRAYDWGLAPSKDLPVPTICVGNISVGGTGKSPLVEWICAHLAAQGASPMIISRGYHANSSGQNDEAQASAWPVHCDPDRHAAGTKAIAAGADWLVMDDGFQHRRLRRDANIVCIDASRPWGRNDGSYGGTLPLGLLREGRSALQRADAIILTRSDQVDAQRLASLHQELASTCPIWTASHQAQDLRDLADQPAGPLSDLHQPVILVSAIGHPEAFESTARKAGAQIISHQRFADHHHYSQQDIDTLLQQAAAAQACLLMTSKDAVKWQSARSDGLAETTVPILVLPICMQLDAAGQTGLEKLLKDCRSRLQERVGTAVSSA